jgi:hypothetical protein
MGLVMSLTRDSFWYKVLRTLDILWVSLDGFTPDLEQLDWVFDERPLFSKEGLIKIDISQLPFRDHKLKKIAKKYGGWEVITDPEFVPPRELYERLEKIGFRRDDFDLSRRYLANPDEYKENARKRRNYEF